MVQNTPKSKICIENTGSVRFYYHSTKNRWDIYKDEALPGVLLVPLK